MAPQKKSRVARSKATKYTKRKRSADLPIDVGDSLNAAPEGEIPPCQPKKKKGRGPAVIMPVKDDPSQRPEVWRVGQHEFSCASNPRLIAATITRLALRLMPAPLRSFHGFDDTSKNNLEIEFLVNFIFRLNFLFSVQLEGDLYSKDRFQKLISPNFGSRSLQPSFVQWLEIRKYTTVTCFLGKKYSLFWFIVFLSTIMKKCSTSAFLDPSHA